MAHSQNPRVLKLAFRIIMYSPHLQLLTYSYNRYVISLAPSMKSIR
jgi:hypothetical protein